MDKVIFKTKIGTFDFSKPKVRLDGRCLHKLDMLRLLRKINPIWYYYNPMEAYRTKKYDDFRAKLLKYCIERY